MIDNGERRPRVDPEAAQGEDLAKSLLISVATDADISGVASEQPTGVDDPRWRAAEILADAWAPALADAFRLGYANGCAAGRWAAEREMQQAWSAMAQPIRGVLRMPTHAELRQRRGESA